MILLLDIGNTRLKWTTLVASALAAQQAESHAGWNAARFTDVVLTSLPRPERVLVSNVGGAGIGGIVRDAIRQCWGVEAEFIVSTAMACGVRNAYPVPANLGVDRWLGVIAAHARQQRLSCIVGVGTALTIDGVDASGQHLGGVIVPGPDLMVSSLLRNTSDIAQRAVQGSATQALFADNTLGAIHQGAAHALAALIERAIDSMRSKAGSEPALLLTGGAAPVIAPLIRVPYESVPDLVLQGLAHYAVTR
ncbi:MAG TPA: type III pantothenate kinase [Povalibacter sp.]|nr:type III pantothenate kinase [Povalibacter sp.]